jgi:structural maintenance of chromosome 2
LALLPGSLDDWVDDSNPVRVIDAFVERLDLKKLGFDSAAAMQAQASHRAAATSAAAAQEKVNLLSSQLAALDFQYRDPERGFNHSRVKGVVAKLLRVNDAATATAGGVEPGANA